MTKDERKAKETCWVCHKCTAKQAPPQAPVDLNGSFEESASSAKTFSKDSLRILQWNANGLKLKSTELETRLKELDIDVAVIQETHLSKKDRTPTIQDSHGRRFNAVRVDRTNTSRGGGLAIYIRESLPFDNVGSRINKGTETSTIRVRLDKKKWVTLTNLYSPPVNSKGQEIAFSVDHIPSSPSSIICGDFNAHHATWDEVQTEDDRGTELSDWVNLNSMAILNNGSVTRHNPSSTADSSKGSTPDEEKGVTVSLFADDVTLLGTDEDRDAASKSVQKVVKKVEDWSSKWKLKLNAAKSEVSFFSRLARESKFEPCVKISNTTIPYKKFPRLLGVILDCQLSFGKQV